MTRDAERIRNIAASVRAKLFNLSKAEGHDFGSVLKLYFLERFLYRLSRSRYSKSFLLMDWTSFQQVQRGNLAAAAALSAPSHFLHIRRALSSAGSEELR